MDLLNQLMSINANYIIIGLLIGIIMFIVQDHQIKNQIKDRCGYTTSKYECVCDANYVKEWKEFQKSGVLNISGDLTLINDLGPPE